MLLVAALALAGCGRGGDTAEQQAEGVTVKTFQFDPDPVEVKAGTTVEWVNEDRTTHTVTSGKRDKPDGDFDGQLTESGGKFSQRFEKPGTYAYHCRIHQGPGMEATVTVK